MRKSLCALTLVVLFLAGCATAFDPSPYTTTEGLTALMASDEVTYVLDVRSPSEYASGHVPGAINVTLDDLDAFIPELPKDAIVVTYCELGGRSGSAQRTLDAAGFKRLVNFVSIDRWTGEVATGSEP